MSASKILVPIGFSDQSIVALGQAFNLAKIKNSDIVLNGTIEKEIDPLGVVPTTSSLVALAIGDALASVLMVQRGFDKEDFARNHPG